MEATWLIANIIRAFAPTTDAHSPLRLELNPAPVVALLTGSVGPDLAASLDALRARWSEGDLPEERALEQWAQVAAKVEAAAAGQQLRQELAPLAESFQTLLAIRQATELPQSALQHIAVDLGASPLTPLVRAWRMLDHTVGRDTTVLQLSSDDPDGYGLSLRGEAFAVRRIALRYEPQQAVPTLQLQTLSAAEGDVEPTDRASWTQYPLPDYDLKLYTEQYRYKGSVITRLSQEPLLVQSGPVTLSYVPKAGHELIVTEIRDEHDRLCGRALRLPPPVEAPGPPRPNAEASR